MNRSARRIPSGPPIEFREQDAELYSGYEREAGNVQDRKRGQGLYRNLDLFDQSVRPGSAVQARKQDADNFSILYRRVQTDTVRVIVERVTNAEAMAQGMTPLRKRGAR